MLIKKIIQTTINISDPGILYSTTKDKDQIINSILEKKYVGKCYVGMYIRRIVRIIKKSQYNNAFNTLDGRFDINITLEVEGEQYPLGSVLAGCYLSNIQGGNPHEGLNIAVYTDGDPRSNDKKIAIVNLTHYYKNIEIPKLKTYINLIKDGMKFPVIVDKVSYTPGKDVMTIKAIPFMPFAEREPIYIIEKDNYKLTELEMIEIDNLYTKIKEKISMFSSFCTCGKCQIPEYLDDIDKFSCKPNTYIKWYMTFRAMIYPRIYNIKFESSELYKDFVSNKIKCDTYKLQSLLDLDCNEKDTTHIMYYTPLESTTSHRGIVYRYEYKDDSEGNISGRIMEISKKHKCVTINTSHYTLLTTYLSKYYLYVCNLYELVNYYANVKQDTLVNTQPYFMAIAK